ncbi:hypothetical protein LPJ58_006811, partial [Coemansia sp. RSA 1591]
MFALFSTLISFFFALLARAISVARFLVVALARIVWQCTSKTLGIESVTVAADIQQQFDAQAKTCLELRRLIAQQETEHAEILENYMDLQSDYEREHERAENYEHTLAGIH